MSALLSPNPVLRFYGNDGQPLSGGYLQTLDSETSNPVATYRDAGMTTENPSIIMLDANGEPSDNGVPVGVFLVPDAVYKFNWFDSDMSLVGSSDGIVAGGGSGSGTGLVEVLGTAEHINVTRSVVRGVFVYRVDLASSLVGEIDSLEESVVQLGDEMDALEGTVASKSDKVQGATAGNLAALDANGNLADSGKKATDFATAEQGNKADTAVQGVKVNGTELSKDGSNKVDVPVPTASTATPLMDGTASAGSSSQWARGDHRHPTDDSREAVSNKAQSIDDTSTTDYPSSKAVAEFVNSSVATNTANFLGTIAESSLGLDYTATNAQIALALNVHSWESSPTNNDYCFVSVNDPQTTDVDEYRRFKFNGSVWAYEYTLNNSSFTQAQWDAINSGLTSSDRTAYNAAVTLLNSHVGDSSIHVTAAQKTAWNGKQDAISDLATIRSGASAGASALQPGGDGSNVTITPDGSSGTTFSSGGKLSALAQKFINLVASLKALAFKDKVSDSDISGTISDSHIASASTWNGKYAKPSGGIPKTDLASAVQTSLGKADTAYQKPSGGIPDSDIASASTWNSKQSALPTSGTASTTYAINVSGKAATAGTADSANSVAWSNVSGKPTVDQNYSATSTNPQAGTAVAQAVAKSYVTTVYSGSSAKSFKAIEFSLTGSSSTNRLLGILEVGAGGSSAQCMFIINAIYTASSHTIGIVVSKLCWFENKTNNLKLAYSIDTTTDKLTIYVKNLSAWYSAQIRVLTAQTESQNRLGYVTVFDNTSVNLPDSTVEFTEIDSRDASWINSGTFDAARIPTSLPNVTVGTATKIDTSNAVGSADSGIYLKANGLFEATPWFNWNQIRADNSAFALPPYAVRVTLSAAIPPNSTRYVRLTPLNNNIGGIYWLGMTGSNNPKSVEVEFSYFTYGQGYIRENKKCGYDTHSNNPISLFTVRKTADSSAAHFYVKVTNNNTSSKNIHIMSSKPIQSSDLAVLTEDEYSALTTTEIMRLDSSGVPNVLNSTITYRIHGTAIALQNGSYSDMTAGYANNLTPSGTAGQYLKSNGSGTAPSWENLPLKKVADVSGMGNDDTNAYSGKAVSMAISSAVSGNVGGFLGSLTVAQMNAYTSPKMGDNAIVTDTGTITQGSPSCVISSAPAEVRWTTSGSWQVTSAGYVRETQVATTGTVGVVKTNSADGGVSLNANNQMVVNGWSGKQATVGTDTDSSAFGDNTTIATGFGSNKVHLNVASRLWTYIQDKISSVLGLTVNSYGGKAASASEVSATATQKALAVSVDGISHTNGSKSTVINGGQVATDTLSADTAVNSDGFWAKSSILVYGGNDPGSPTGNYILMSPNGIACYGTASFTGPLVGNASTATAVKDYGNTSKSIEIGYAGNSLTSANHLAAYAVVDGHTYIKDISPSNVTVGRATADGSGNNIVNTYQPRTYYGPVDKTFSVSVGGGEEKSIGDRNDYASGAGIAWPSLPNVPTIFEVTCDVMYVVPVGGSSVAVILKCGNSYNGGTVLDSVRIDHYSAESVSVVKRVRLTRGLSDLSNLGHLYLGILNGTSGTLPFSVYNVKIMAIPNYADFRNI